MSWANNRIERDSVHLCVMEETRDFIPKDDLLELEPVEEDVEQ